MCASKSLDRRLKHHPLDSLLNDPLNEATSAVAVAQPMLFLLYRLRRETYREVHGMGIARTKKDALVRCVTEHSRHIGIWPWEFNADV